MHSRDHQVACTVKEKVFKDEFVMVLTANARNLI